MRQKKLNQAMRQQKLRGTLAGVVTASLLLGAAAPAAYAKAPAERENASDAMATASTAQKQDSETNHQLESGTVASQTGGKNAAEGKPGSTIFSEAEGKTATASTAASMSVEKTSAASEEALTEADTATPSVPEEDELHRLSGFDNDGPLPVQLTDSISLGEPNADGGVAEIVAFDANSQTAFVVNGQAGVLNVVPFLKDGSFGEVKAIDVETLVDEKDPDFYYGDMTSVTVDSEHGRLAVALQEDDYSAKGRAALLSFDGELLDLFETGVQPDMITFAQDGRLLLTANEGEPRQSYGAGQVDPPGSVSIIELASGKTTNAGFDGFDSEELLKQNVLIGRVNGELNPAERDLEPEYIAVDERKKKAYVTLQEANAIAVLDLTAKKMISVQSAGFQNHSLSNNKVDFNEDGQMELARYKDVFGVRMPDGISLYQDGGKTYLLTANEGDAREWGVEDTPDFYLNEAKKKLETTDGTETEKKVRVLDAELVAGFPEEDALHTFGSRSFTIFEVNGGKLKAVYDSGSDFEKLTGKFLPDYFNASNDDIELDSRSAKKGPEPESITVGKVGTRSYAFVALERIGGVMIYDITNPKHTKYVNYINTRDFSGDIAGDVAPEGLCFIPAKDSASESPYLLAACEVSGTLAAYRLGKTPATATPSEPEKPATPSEPEKPEQPATPSEPEKPEQPDKPSEPDEDDRPAGSGNSSSSSGSSGATGKTAYQPDGTKSAGPGKTQLDGSWHRESGKGWRFRKSDGSEVKNSWGLIDGKWYHFDSQGDMQTGWFTEQGRSYYLAADGSMLANAWMQDPAGQWYAFNPDGSRMEQQWYQYKGAWYYLGADGVLLTNSATPDGYQVDAAGKWNGEAN